MSRPRIAWSVAVATAMALVFSPLLPAQNCPGDAGYELTINPEIPIGNNFFIDVKAPTGNLILLAISGGAGPNTTPYGPLCLDFPLLGIFPFVMPAPSLSIPHFIPCEPSMVGAVGHLQFIAVDSSSNQIRLSNDQPLTIVDGDCGDCCDNGKPVKLLMQYTGAGCDASNHSQDASKVSCSGDPMMAPAVNIRVSDKNNPTDNKAKVFFEGAVDLFNIFCADATNIGDGKFKAATFVHVFDPAGNLLQTVEFHTSCSVPLFANDQFGSIKLIECAGENDPVGGGDPEDDCCVDGKPAVLTMKYTGEGCSASSHSQSDDKVSCNGDPAGASTVRIVAASKENLADSKTKIWFDGLVNLNEEFDIDAANEDKDKLDAKTFVFIYDTNDTLLQSLEFHTSCSQPLFHGDQFGSLLLTGCRGEDEPVDPGDPADNCCADGKPATLTLKYTGDGCSATSHSQDNDKVSCNGDPSDEATVRIVAASKENLSDPKAKVWFDGIVNLNEEFDLKAANANEDKLDAKTFVFVYDTNDTLLQSVEFHTSCSQPLFLGNQFGSLLLTGCEGEDEPTGPGDPADNCCADGVKVAGLVMQYTGQNCASSDNSQTGDKFICTGSSVLPDSVRIIAASKEKLDDSKTIIWFDKVVNLAETFTIDATESGESKLKAETHLFIFDASDNSLVQSVEFHTSCSQPLFIGDIFGSAMLLACIPEK